MNWKTLDEQTKEYNDGLCIVKNELVSRLGDDIARHIMEYMEDFEVKWSSYDSIDLKRT
jgi:hypothetical protein